MSNPQTYLGQSSRYGASARIIADESVAMTIRYIGTEASATVTVASGELTCKSGTAGAETVDNTVGVSGVVSDATYTTLGAYVDAINKSPNWEAELVDCLRADTSTNVMKALSEHTLSPKREPYALYLDTSVSLSLTRAISNRRGDYRRSQKGLQSFLNRTRQLVNVGSGTLTLSIYTVSSDRGTSTLLATFSGTDNTELDVNPGADAPYTSKFGQDLLVRYVMSVDLPDSGAYMQVEGWEQ